MTDDTGAALYRVILASPAENTPRMLYADEIEESQPERASLIRCQYELTRLGQPHKRLSYPDEPVALTKHGDKHYSFTGYTEDGLEVGDRLDLLVRRPEKKPKWVYGFRVYRITLLDERIRTARNELDVFIRLDKNSGPDTSAPLRQRERDLLRAHGAEWSRELCEALGGKDALGPSWNYTRSGERVEIGEFYSSTSNDPRWRFERGFPAVLACRWEAWVGGFCEAVQGSGGMYDHCNCGKCDGDGRVPGLCETVAWRDGWTVACRAVGPHHGDRCSGGRVQAPNAQFTQRCPAGCDEGRVPQPCPPAAQPWRKVVLTTVPELERSVQGDSTSYRLPEKSRWHTYSDKAWVTREEIYRDLFTAEWPGLEFEVRLAAEPVGV